MKNDPNVEVLQNHTTLDIDNLLTLFLIKLASTFDLIPDLQITKYNWSCQLIKRYQPIIHDRYGTF